MVPADLDTANFQERLMNVFASLITNMKASILVQPRDTAFCLPVIDTRSASVFSPTLSQQGDNSSTTKLSPMKFRIAALVAQNTIRTLNRPADSARDWRNAASQGQQLRNIMPVCTDQYHRKRDSISVCYQMMFRAFLAAIRRIWACFRPPKNGSH
jgi:hypothetical protein